MTRGVFPFTAIVGQERMVRALILNAVSPQIGGVLELDDEVGDERQGMGLPWAGSGQGDDGRTVVLLLDEVGEEDRSRLPAKGLTGEEGRGEEEVHVEEDGFHGAAIALLL